jgi:hypothetical protein
MILMLGNDNRFKDSCYGEELQRILNSSGCNNGNRPSPDIDLPSCENSGKSYGLKDYPLAMVYSPMQEFDRLYDLDRGFVAGTIFTDLDLPFSGRSLKYRGNSGGCYDK